MTYGMMHVIRSDLASASVHSRHFRPFRDSNVSCINGIPYPVSLTRIDALRRHGCKRLTRISRRTQLVRAAGYLVSSVQRFLTMTPMIRSKDLFGHHDQFFSRSRTSPPLSEMTDFWIWASIYKQLAYIARQSHPTTLPSLGDVAFSQFFSTEDCRH